MIVATDAIVVKHMRYRETSRIVTLYTREFGRISGLAKGSRDLKSKFGGALEPLTFARIVLYRREGRDLHLLSQADIVDPYARLHAEIERLAVGFSVAEMLLQIVHGEERHPALFQLTQDALAAIDRAPSNVTSVLPAFELRLASLHGFRPDFSACVSCGLPLPLGEAGEALLFVPMRGGLLCPTCRKTGRADREAVTIGHRRNIPAPSGVQQESLLLRTATVRLLRNLLELPLDSVPSCGMDAAVGNDVDEAVRLYLRVHFGELKPLKSRQLLAGLPVQHPRNSHHGV